MKNLLITLAEDIPSTGTDIDKPGTIGSGDTDLVGDITTIINVIIGLLSIVAVIVIIIGGINYMTSTGDAGKVKKAKDTILYGLIGLVVCGLAAAIVNFVVAKIITGA